MGEVSLKKKLQDSGEAPLVNDQDQPLGSVKVGVGWDAKAAVKRGILGKKKETGKDKDVDLDLVAVVMNRRLEPVRVCSWKRLSVYDGALVLGGDNRTGQGEGADEEMSCDFSKLEDDFGAVVFVLTAYDKKVTFKDIEGGFWEITDTTNGSAQRLAKVNLSINQAQSALAFAVFKLEGEQWKLRSISQYGRGNDEHGVFELAAMALNASPLAA